MIDVAVVKLIFEGLSAEDLEQVESLAREARLRCQAAPRGCDACDSETLAPLSR